MLFFGLELGACAPGAPYILSIPLLDFVHPIARPTPPRVSVIVEINQQHDGSLHACSVGHKPPAGIRNCDELTCARYIYSRQLM